MQKFQKGCSFHPISTKQMINIMNMSWEYRFLFFWQYVKIKHFMALWFLALLDFVSRSAELNWRPASVHKLVFLENHCMDPGQTLWVAPSPPYLRADLFSFFKIFNFQIFTFFLSFLLTWDYGSKISKTLCTPPPFFIWSEPNFISKKVI